MQLNLGQSLRQDVRLDQQQEQRLELRQKLDLALAQQLHLSISLTQYLEREDAIKSIIRWTDENGRWRQFDKDGFLFTYAGIPQRIAREFVETYGPGFAHCFMNPFEALILGKKTALAHGDWTIFVAEDAIPKSLVDMVAIHERGEQISLGNHYFASKLEFAYALHRHKVKPYLKFVDDEFPHKFVDLTQEVGILMPDELRDELQQRGSEYVQETERANTLIEKYPLPDSVIKLMLKYTAATNQFTQRIEKEIGPTQYALQPVIGLAEGNSLENAQRAATIANTHLCNVLGTIDPADARGISRMHAMDALINFARAINNNVYRGTNHHLNFPEDFPTAYADVLNRRPLITARVKPEDNVQHRAQKNCFNTQI